MIIPVPRRDFSGHILWLTRHISSPQPHVLYFPFPHRLWLDFRLGIDCASVYAYIRLLSTSFHAKRMDIYGDMEFSRNFPGFWIGWSVERWEADGFERFMGRKKGTDGYNSDRSHMAQHRSPESCYSTRKIPPFMVFRFSVYKRPL